MLFLEYDWATLSYTDWKKAWLDLMTGYKFSSSPLADAYNWAVGFEYIKVIYAWICHVRLSPKDEGQGPWPNGHPLPF